MKNSPSVRIIAFYLPQFHPIPENDKWHGAGFTEWTNTAKARPYFKGHRQPNIPGELGFYDLRLKETRIQQARLAMEYGIEGFCYWHYWLGNGKRLLEKPMNEVLESGSPEFPFCLGWANHSWTGKWFGTNDMIAEQRYPGMGDHKLHFEYLLKAFKDSRYIKVDGRPLLYIYKPKDIPNVKDVLNYWRELSKQSGLNGLYIIGEHTKIQEIEIYGLDACAYSGHTHIQNYIPKNRYLRKLENKWRKYSKRPKVYKYSDAINYFLRDSTPHKKEHPSIIPNWDTTPRLGSRGLVLHDSTPELFRKHIREVFSKVKKIDSEFRIVFVKSWNEWAEGNYLEPDRYFKRKYLEVLRDELFENNQCIDQYFD